jgi:hypothetical protein
MQEALTACDTPASIDALAEKIEAIYGQTVGDARRLLKRAKEVVVHYRTGFGDHSDIIFISKRVFEESIRWKKPHEDMPCELRDFGGSHDIKSLKLVIGSYGALLRIREARDAATA